MSNANQFPIIEHYPADPPSELHRQVEQYAQQLRKTRPELKTAKEFAGLEATTLDDAPTLHLDDQSDIPFLEGWRDITCRQDLARMRAGDGDLVGACIAPVDGFEAYCRDRLRLGSAEWLKPAAPHEPLQVAAELWRDADSRHRLVEAARHHGRLQIDPYKSCEAVWQLALLIKEQSKSDVCVIGPPPQITEWVNDKLEFSKVVEHLFSPRLTPRTLSAGNLAKAAQLVHELAQTSEKVVIKLPDSAGGGGNVVFPAGPFRHSSLHEAREELKRAFRGYDWEGECELLVGEWETGVITAPSVQTWIPPGNAPPVVEGTFEQAFGDDRGGCVGSRRPSLPAQVEQEMVDRSWLLASLFQQLGYVGRCSFDMLIVDEGTGSPHLQFLECNGRWGAASMPMTLMNRLFGDWTRQPYASRDFEHLGLEEVPFSHLLEALGDDLFDARTGRGRWILLNPARMQARGGISAIVLAEDWNTAAQSASTELPQRLREIATHV